MTAPVIPFCRQLEAHHRIRPPIFVRCTDSGGEMCFVAARRSALNVVDIRPSSRGLLNFSLGSGLVRFLNIFKGRPGEEEPMNFISRLRALVSRKRAVDRAPTEIRDRVRERLDHIVDEHPIPPWPPVMDNPALMPVPFDTSSFVIPARPSEPNPSDTALSATSAGQARPFRIRRTGLHWTRPSRLNDLDVQAKIARDHLDGMTLQAIAERDGYLNHAGVSRALKRFLDKYTDAPAPRPGRTHRYNWAGDSRLAEALKRHEEWQSAGS